MNLSFWEILGNIFCVWFLYWIIKVHCLSISNARYERRMKRREWMKPVTDACVKAIQEDREEMEKKYMSDKKYARIRCTKSKH